MILLQYQGIGFVSSVIRWFGWFGKRQYSHSSCTNAAIERGRLVGDTSEWESWYKGGVQHVEMVGDMHKRGTRIDLYELIHPLSRDELERGRLWLEDQLGAGYDWRGIIHFISHKKDLDCPDKWFCSELMLAYLRVMGRCILAGVEPYQCHPGLLATSTELRYVGYIIVGDGLRVYQDEPVRGIGSLLHGVLSPA